MKKMTNENGKDISEDHEQVEWWAGSHASDSTPLSRKRQWFSPKIWL